MERIEAIPLELAHHPPYSPNLALSDFFLFDYIKKLPVMNSVLRMSWTTISGMSFL
jgi:hypothetical protein